MMQESILKVGDLCKHFKGENLIDKNIYKILAVGVTYSGVKVEEKLENLVVYENIFQNKIFTREYEDLARGNIRRKTRKVSSKISCRTFI